MSNGNLDNKISFNLVLFGVKKFVIFILLRMDRMGQYLTSSLGLVLLLLGGLLQMGVLTGQLLNHILQSAALFVLV